MNLSDALALYLEALRRRGRAPATLDSYQRYLNAYLTFLAERGIAQPTLAHLSIDLVEAAQDHVRQRAMGRRDGAVAEHAFVQRLRLFGRFLWRRNFYDSDPLARIELPRLPSVHRVPFSDDEVIRLVRAAELGPNPILERALLLLGMDTGARIGELCGASLADLDLDNRAILFRQTKGGRPRRVLFGVSFRDDGGPCVVALRQWLAVREAPYGVTSLFMCPDGRPLTPPLARRMYSGLGATAGVRDCFPHRARHTHASRLLAQLPGAEIQLRHRLGHVGREVLAAYITISDPLAQSVADVASISAALKL